MQLEAYEMQCAALAPKIEAMEASWNRLRSISGAQTTEDVIDYFFSLRRKEENMRELVAQVGGCCGNVGCGRWMRRVFGDSGRPLICPLLGCHFRRRPARPRPRPR